MFKKKNIALTLSLLALLASCGEKPATSSASSENTARIIFATWASIPRS